MASPKPRLHCPGFRFKKPWTCYHRVKVYIKAMLQQYLLKDNYKYLSHNEAFYIMSQFELELSEAIKFKHVDELTDQEYQFFHGLSTRHRIPQPE